MARITEETGVTNIRWEDDLGIDKSTIATAWDYVDVYWNFGVNKIAVQSWTEGRDTETYFALENPDMINDAARRAITIVRELRKRRAENPRNTFYS
jgi:hypothetical protein